jgi:hypothetical protein
VCTLYSSYFVLLAAFLLVKDIPKIWNLLILERFTVPNSYYPSFTQKWQQYAPLWVQSRSCSACFWSICFTCNMSISNTILTNSLPRPASKRCGEIINVTEFRVNDTGRSLIRKLIRVRWQWATFEKLDDIDLQSQQTDPAFDLSNGGGAPMKRPRPHIRADRNWRRAAGISLSG